MSFFDYSRIDLSLWHIVPGIAVRVRVKGPSLRYVPQGPRCPLRASFGKKLGSGSGLASLSQPNASLKVSGVSVRVRVRAITYVLFCVVPGVSNVCPFLIAPKDMCPFGTLSRNSLELWFGLGLGLELGLLRFSEYQFSSCFVDCFLQYSFNGEAPHQFC